MKVIYPITLDVKKTNIQKKIRAFTEEGGTRELVITLVSGNDTIEVPNNYVVSICGVKPDGTKFANTATVEDGKIHYTLTTQNVAVEGDVDCQVRVTKTGELLYSSKFVITVEGNLSDEETETSSNEWTELITALNRVNDLAVVFTGEGAPTIDPTDYPDIQQSNWYFDTTNEVYYYAASVSTIIIWKRIYNKTETDAALDLKADKSTTYTKTETDAALDLKADKSTTYTKTETNALVEPKLNVYIGEDNPSNGIVVSSDYTGIKVGDIYLWKVSESVYKVCVVNAVRTIVETTRFYCNTLADRVEIPLITADTTPPESASAYSYKHPKNGTTWFNNTTGKYYVKTGESGAMPETTFTWDEIVTLTQFTTALNLKADKSTTYTKTQIDTDRPKIYTAKGLDIEKGVEAKDYTSSSPSCDDFTNVKAGDIVKDETSSTLNGVYVVTDLWEESSKTYFKCTKVRRNVYFEEEYEVGGVTYTSPPSAPSSFYEKIEPGALWICEDTTAAAGTYKVYVNNGVSDSNNMYVWFEAVSSSRLSNYATKYYVDTGLAAKQDTIDSSHKLSADLVTDSTTTNKFVPTHSSTESGKVLGVDTNGDLEWTTKGSGGSYSGGDGIDITNDTISVDLKSGTELQITSGELDIDLSNYATTSSVSGKEDKTTISTDTTSTTASLTLADNHEYRYTQDLASLTLTMPSGDFISSIVFASGSTPTSMTYDSSIKWSGDDVTSNAFVPVASKTYNIVMWYDGINVNGVVRGVA